MSVNMRYEILAAAVAAFSLAATAGETALTWGGREERPAVVNPVLQDKSGNVVSLRGEWEFSANPMKAPWRNGGWQQPWRKEKWPDSRRIMVPGCWEAQGVGEPGQS